MAKTKITHDKKTLIKQHKTFFESLKDFYGSISYAIVPFLIYLLSWLGSWGLTQLFGATTGIQPWIELDFHIPCVPEFVYAYYLTFPLGIVAYFYLAKANRTKLYEITIIMVTAYIISGLFYIFMQTEFPMEVKESFISNPKTISEKLTVLTWHASHPTNCLPSQHCFMAIGITMCALGTKGIKTWFKCVCYVMSVLIVLATFFIKQHFVLDFVASFAIMMTLFVIVKIFKLGKKLDARICARKQSKQRKKIYASLYSQENTQI